MAHIVNGTKTFRTTDRKWLALGAQVGELANEWSGRGDLIAYVGDDGGQGMAPAIYVPHTAEIELNTEIAFTKNVKPYMIEDMTIRRVQFDNAKAAGAVWHEAQHAKYTRWSLPDANEEFKKEPGAMRALMNLEESRIEALGVKVQPENKAFMRACALEIVMGDRKEIEALGISPTRQLAHTMALTTARVDAGILEADDISSVTKQIDAVMPADLQEKLRAIWREFQTIEQVEHRRNLERMYTLARKWDTLVEDAATAAGEPSAQDIADAMAAAMGESGEGTEGEGSEGADSVIDALGADADSTAVDAQGEADAQRREERDKAIADAAQQKAEERADHKANAQKVFNKGTGPGSGATNSRLVESRPPTNAERIAANSIARALEEAKYRDRERVVSNTQLPPGRLRTRTLIDAEVARQRGSVVLPDAWKRVQRKQTDEPKLTIGMMVDISGSMSSAMEPMAVTAWAMSEAARRIQAKIAMVYYGQDVFPTLEPGRHLDEVRVYSARDSTEKFERAFKALDGTLDLLTTNGARLLVVVSDGHYVATERENAVKWLRRCRDEGVGVLWIGLTGSYGGDAAEGYCKEAGGTYIQTNYAVTDAAIQIGAAGAKALEAVGNRR